MQFPSWMQLGKKCHSWKPLELCCHGKAIAYRQNCCEQIGRRIKKPVELLDRLRRGFRRRLLGNSPAPQHIVGNEQSAFAQSRECHAKSAGIVFLIYIAKNYVELLSLF